MDAEQIRECIAVMESRENRPAIERMRDTRDSRTRNVLRGTDSDERDRGWIEALNWVLTLPEQMRKELSDESQKRKSLSGESAD